MKNFKYFFPNSLTIINLLLGCLAIIISFRGQNEYNAAWLIILAAFFDMLDGLVARALNAKSEFGAQLDSLADMVSFGIAPTVILFNWFVLVLTKQSELSTFALVSANLGQSLLLFCSLLYAAAAAIRLARFNVSEKNQKGFNGMPTPAAAIIVASLWLILGASETGMAQSLLLNIYLLLGIVVSLIVLMVSNLKMMSLKFTGLGFTENFFPYLLIILGVVLIVLFWVHGIFFIMMIYILLSIIRNLVINQGK